MKLTINRKIAMNFMSYAYKTFLPAAVHCSYAAN